MNENTGFIAIARPTFDVHHAAKKSQQAFDKAIAHYPGLVGSPNLVMDLESMDETIRSLDQVSSLIVFQATFADSSLISRLVASLTIPVLLWATPEERTGGRLRLNSFCGINLAAYVLARGNVTYTWLVADPDSELQFDEIKYSVESSSRDGVLSVTDSPLSIDGQVVGVVGTRPDGFEPCDYDARVLEALVGVTVDEVGLDDLFDAANNAPPSTVVSTIDRFSKTLDAVDQQDPTALEQSVRLHLGLKDMADTRGWSGVATRCWPECFTEYGGAACAPLSALTSDGIPGTCEADVYGNVTSLLLKSVSGDAPFVADMVDVDVEGNTVVFWHCGLAPIEMASSRTRPTATVHSNRNKPLLNQFSLKAGTVTVARLSQSANTSRLVLGLAEMVEAPLPFAGTSGVARVPDASRTLDTIMRNGLEHHYGLVYGDHTRALTAYAGSIGIPVVELT